MIVVPQEILDQMVRHSKDELPNESCGYLSGSDSEVRTCYEMTNLDQSPEHFSFDPKEQFSVMKQAREKDERLVGVYHSHPETPARLSQEDLRLLNDPNMVYFIVSLMGEEADVKAFMIKKESEEDIHIKQIEIKTKK